MSELRSNAELPIFICGSFDQVVNMLNNPFKLASPGVRRGIKTLTRENSRIIGPRFQRRADFLRGITFESAQLTNLPHFLANLGQFF